MKYFFILLLFLSSCISTLTANEYGQKLNNKLTSLNYKQSELPRVTVDSVKVVISEKPYEKPVVANRFEYLPYGETWITEGDTHLLEPKHLGSEPLPRGELVGDNPKYNSQELDKETNFYFYNARHYDPEVSDSNFRFKCQANGIPEINGVVIVNPVLYPKLAKLPIARFVTADTVIDGEGSVKGWNRYMYVAGNPIRYKDPTGHEIIFKYLNKNKGKYGTIEEVKYSEFKDFTEEDDARMAKKPKEIQRLYNAMKKLKGSKNKHIDKLLEGVSKSKERVFVNLKSLKNYEGFRNGNNIDIHNNLKTNKVKGLTGDIKMASVLAHEFGHWATEYLKKDGPYLTTAGDELRSTKYENIVLEAYKQKPITKYYDKETGVKIDFSDAISKNNPNSKKPNFIPYKSKYRLNIKEESSISTRGKSSYEENYED